MLLATTWLWWCVHTRNKFTLLNGFLIAFEFNSLISHFNSISLWLLFVKFVSFLCVCLCEWNNSKFKIKYEPECSQQVMLTQDTRKNKINNEEGEERRANGGCGCGSWCLAINGSAKIYLEIWKDYWSPQQQLCLLVDARPCAEFSYWNPNNLH